MDSLDAKKISAYCQCDAIAKSNFRVQNVETLYDDYHTKKELVLIMLLINLCGEKMYKKFNQMLVHV